MIRTEQIWLPPDKAISSLCHTSKNLYNQANYIVKNADKENWIRYGELNKILKNESENYKSLPTQTAQQILMLLDKSWKSFFNALKEYVKHPEKFLAKPNAPHYKAKSGEHVLVFTNQQCRIKNNILKMPKTTGLKIETRLLDETNLKQVRIIPKGVGYVCEIVYEKEVGKEGKDQSRVVGIDFGSKNIIAMVNNIGLKPIIVKDDGTGLKSVNQYYNKKKAEIQSIYDLQEIKDGDKLKRLRNKRDRKIHNEIHKLSKGIVNWCKDHDIGTIVVGHNKNWKQKIGIGKRNNQNFVMIAFDKIIQKLKYKAEEAGIVLKEQDESHTSICSFLDNEPVEHHDKYVGKRIRRGLFRTAKGLLINADVNAGYNIIRKSEPELFVRAEMDGVGGCALHPLCCYITHKGTLSNV